jgi:hypothetical protein
MALQHNILGTDNTIGVDFTGAYTVVVNMAIAKEARYNAPAEEGGDPVLRVKHTLKFDTLTYTSKANYDAGKDSIAEHHYIEDYPLDYSEANSIAYAYEWLKTNVVVYSSATDV